MFGIDSLIGAGIGALGSFIGADQQKKALENLKLARPNYENVGQAQQQFASQLGQLPAVAALLGKSSSLDNLATQNRILADNPEAEANTTATSKLAEERSLGGLSQDTQDAIKRANAYAALQGGYAGSTMADTAGELRTAQARQKMIASAPQLNSQAFGMAEELNPVNPDVGATLLSPGAILQRSDQEQNYNTDILNQGRLAKAGVAAGNAQQQGSLLTTGVAGLMGGIGSLMRGGGWGDSRGYGFGLGDTGPTADSQFTSSGAWTGGWP